MAYVDTQKKVNRELIVLHSDRKYSNYICSLNRPTLYNPVKCSQTIFLTWLDCYVFLNTILERFTMYCYDMSALV